MTDRLSRLRGLASRVLRDQDAAAARALRHRILESLGRIEARQLASARGPIGDHEFQVFSQGGDDGIIQYLISLAPLPTVFVEIGVEDYQEANTRFLVANNQWSGLVIDADTRNVDRIRKDSLYWNRRLDAVAAFIDRDNVNEILERAGYRGDIGLLSVDIDGNDYWVFDSITAVRPAVAVVEYNYRFGPTRSVTIPYRADHRRSRSDASWFVTGASLAAIVGAAARKGLAFMGCNSFGNNAYFFREELVPEWFARPSVEAGFRRGQFRESMVIRGRHVEPTEAEIESMIAAADLVELS